MAASLEFTPTPASELQNLTVSEKCCQHDEAPGSPAEASELHTSAFAEVFVISCITVEVYNLVDRNKFQHLQNPGC